MLNFVHFIKHLRHTGAVAPSSKFLAEEVVRSLSLCNRYGEKPIRVLELGPGTGVITAEIIKCIRPDDIFDIVELDPDFSAEISEKYASESVSVFCMDFLDFHGEQPYDFIISSLPYDMIPGKITQKIWEKKLELSEWGTEISYYKYYKFNHFRSKFELEINRRYFRDKKLIWKNVPPAVVYNLKIANRESAYQKRDISVLS